MKILLRLLMLAVFASCPFMFGMEMGGWHAIPGKEVFGADLNAKLAPNEVDDMLKNVTLYYEGAEYKKGPKSRILFVYGNTESYAGQLRGFSTEVIVMLEKIAPSLFASIISKSLEQAKTTASAYPQQFEVLTYQHQNKADRLTALIEVLNKEDNKLIIFAEGDSANQVNLATRVLGSNKNIHALIYFQSPVYEKQQPAMFDRLYNFYTKKDAQVKGLLGSIYIERKYYQQVRMVGEFPVMPVKNISVLKDLAFMPPSEFVTVDFLKKVPMMVSNIEKYSINFDLFTHIQGENAHVAINRFIKLDEKNNVVAPYGDEYWGGLSFGWLGGFYTLFNIPASKPEFSKSIISRFTLDVLESQRQLKEMLPKSATGDKKVTEYFDRVNAEHQNIGKNWLFNPTFESDIAKGPFQHFVK
jgi:hypothetical protein